MIERGLKLWTAVISFSEKNPDIVPDNLRLRRADRSTFDSLLEILTPMAKATARFSKKTRPMIGEVVGMFERLDSVFSTIEDDKARPDAWRKAAERARKVVSKYYGLSEQTEVYILHPNYRLEFLEAMKWEEDWKEAAIDVLRTTFNNFYKIQPVESQDDDASQNDEEEEEDDPVTLAMMKRSLTRKAQAK
ncbi:hypothetical protein OC842_007369 [Tilletia horrida]|uniref:hAT-like transposase RNase-H fold domain-containing protein n=1 Tax=Tilletia horrida TaxID=155126 RepID=A0AAN6G698_9BASI|nr:hypothetical protein OC842_007369 [Tilletia horrida]